MAELVGESIGILIAVSIGYWVYKDATSRGSSHAALWAIGVSLFLIVILPLYLICRPTKPDYTVQNRNPENNHFNGNYPEDDDVTLLSSEYIYCPNCGRHHDARKRFCSHCGYDFSNK